MQCFIRYDPIEGTASTKLQGVLLPCHCFIRYDSFEGSEIHKLYAPRYYDALFFIRYDPIEATTRFSLAKDAIGCPCFIRYDPIEGTASYSNRMSHCLMCNVSLGTTRLRVLQD